MADEAKYAADVAKYTSTCDDASVAGIVKHCGIALRSRDASTVSCTDEGERKTVRDSFLKKKLGRTESDAELDAAVLEVCEKMKDTRSKSRVTFYYLLAEKYGQLDVFR
ncbi:MAG: DUF2853 family protein [Pseudomonadota bacterium]